MTKEIPMSMNTGNPSTREQAATDNIIDDILRQFSPKVPRGMGPHFWTEDDYAEDEILAAEGREADWQIAQRAEAQRAEAWRARPAVTVRIGLWVGNMPTSRQEDCNE